jgi:tryptophan-rich sensory protein
MNMNKNNWKTYAFWILLSEAVGLLAGLLTRTATEAFGQLAAQPPLSPPSIVFPIVWSILFALMGIGAARVYLVPPSSARTRSLLLFLLQLAFNFFWSIIFFNFQAFGFALIWLAALWVLILLMILSFRQVDPLAAWLQLPYLLWVTFAAYLNFAVWLLNE